MKTVNNFNCAKILVYIVKKDKKALIEFLALLICMVSTAIFEALSIGSVVPFIGILSGSGLNFKNEFLTKIIDNQWVNNPKLTTSIIFAFAIAFAAFLRIYLLKKITQFTFKLGKDLTNILYSKIIYQNYKFYLQESSSEIILGLTRRVDEAIYYGILPLLTIISSAIMISFIVTTLLVANFELTTVIFIILIFIYYFIIKKIKNNILKNSLIQNEYTTLQVGHIQKTIGNIRDIIINNHEEIYIKRNDYINTKIREAQADINIYANVPKFIIEVFAVLAIVIFSYISRDQEGALILMALIALAAQKLLPLMQQAYNSFVNIKGSNNALNIIVKYLNLSQPKENISSGKINFQSIEFIGLSVKRGDYNVFDNLNFSIKRGQKVAIIGKSGAGKTTFAEILTGLIEPINGEIYINKKDEFFISKESWRKTISYVPQNLYIVDGTIQENIVLDNKNIDIIKLEKVIKSVQMDQFINSKPLGLGFNVGEYGNKLSGGQKQRIGIARALYKEADIIIFDEPTSALDSSSEISIINTILGLNPEITAIVISHSQKIIQLFENVYEIANGSINKIK